MFGDSPLDYTSNAELAKQTDAANAVTKSRRAKHCADMEGRYRVVLLTRNIGDVIAVVMIPHDNPKLHLHRCQQALDQTEGEGLAQTLRNMGYPAMHFHEQILTRMQGHNKIADEIVLPEGGVCNLGSSTPSEQDVDKIVEALGIKPGAFPGVETGRWQSSQPNLSNMPKTRTADEVKKVLKTKKMDADEQPPGVEWVIHVARKSGATEIVRCIDVADVTSTLKNSYGMPQEQVDKLLDAKDHFQGVEYQGDRFTLSREMPEDSVEAWESRVNSALKNIGKMKTTSLDAALQVENIGMENIPAPVLDMVQKMKTRPVDSVSVTDDDGEP